MSGKIPSTRVGSGLKSKRLHSSWRHLTHQMIQTARFVPVSYMYYNNSSVNNLFDASEQLDTFNTFAIVRCGCCVKKLMSNEVNVWKTIYFSKKYWEKVWSVYICYIRQSRYIANRSNRVINALIHILSHELIIHLFLAIYHSFFLRLYVQTGHTRGVHQLLLWRECFHW